MQLVQDNGQLRSSLFDRQAFCYMSVRLIDVKVPKILSNVFPNIVRKFLLVSRPAPSKLLRLTT
jgi:N-acyl-L-homoserine lactone synthetase